MVKTRSKNSKKLKDLIGNGLNLKVYIDFRIYLNYNYNQKYCVIVSS